MEIHKAEENGVVVLSPDAAVFDAASDQLFEALRECLDRGQARLVVDLASVAFLDSQALEALVDARAAVRAMGGDLVLCRPTSACKDILKVTRLDAQFEVFEDRSGAIRSFE